MKTEIEAMIKAVTAKEEEYLDTLTYTLRDIIAEQDFALALAKEKADAIKIIVDERCEKARRLTRVTPNEMRKMSLDQLQARESEIKAALDEVREAKDIRRIVEETRHGVEILVQHLPDAKKPPHIEYAEAVAIMKRKGGDMTDRTLRNWLKAGNAGRVKLPISWDNLASTESWSAWVDYYLGKEKIRITSKRNYLTHERNPQK